MRVMIVAFLTVGVIATAAWVILDNLGYSAAERQASDTVRLPVADE